MDSHTLFAKTPPFRLFLIAAIPGSISMLASALYQLIDGMLVGQLLGGTQFAALNFAMPFVVINFSLADLIGVGSAVPISVSLGQKREEEANNIFSCACLMIVGAGVAIGALLYAAAPGLLSLMGAEGELLSYAVTYMRVYAICSPITTIIFAVDNYLRICGRIRMSMFMNIFMSVLTAALEFVFLYVFKLGIGGAALATCMGMGICAVLSFWPFIRGKMLLRFARPHFSTQLIRKIITCGAPNFLNNIAGRVTSILMNILLLRFGGEMGVSVYGILMYVEAFIQPLLYGMCDSLQPAVSYNLGAGNHKRIYAIQRCCYSASGILSLVSAALIFLFPEQIAGIFISGGDPAYAKMAAGALSLFALTYVTRWFSFATQSFMLAIERAGEATLISLSTALLFPVILLGALWPLGLTGIWLNFAGTSLLAGILSGIILLRMRRTVLSDRH